jgi:hypothetical protein
MNSVLQCLANTKPLLLFSLKDDLEKHLNTSTTSVMKGVLMRGLKITKQKKYLILIYYLRICKFNT